MARRIRPLPEALRLEIEACFGSPERIPDALLSDNEARRRAAYFRAAGSPVRLQILQLLGRGPLCGCVLTGVLRRSHADISRHLQILASQGLIRSERSGRWVQYRLTPQGRRILAAPPPPA